jgi:hypothetical protein
MYDPQRQIATDPAGYPLGPNLKKGWITTEGTHTNGDGGDNAPESGSRRWATSRHWPQPTVWQGYRSTLPTTGSSPPARSPGPLWFLLHLWEGGSVEHGYAMDPDTGGLGPVFFSSQDSTWCELSIASEDGIREVWEGGPRRLWANIEAATEFWRQLGEPGWSRFGLTVLSDDKQAVWLDEPNSDNRWSLPL